MEDAAMVLAEALESVAEKNVTKVIVLCFDKAGPVGWLSNVADPVERLGLIEFMKLAIAELEE